MEWAGMAERDVDDRIVRMRVFDMHDLAIYPCGLRRLFRFVQALCRYGRHALSI